MESTNLDPNVYILVYILIADDPVFPSHWENGSNRKRISLSSHMVDYIWTHNLCFPSYYHGHSASALLWGQSFHLCTSFHALPLSSEGLCSCNYHLSPISSIICPLLLDNLITYKYPIVAPFKHTCTHTLTPYFPSFYCPIACCLYSKTIESAI